MEPITIKYKYLFERGCIFEMSFNNLTDSAEIKDKYQWILIYNNKRYELEFVKKEENQRWFNTSIYNLSNVYLDMKNKKLVLTHKVGNCSNSTSFNLD